ncbi:MAG TPA: DUF2083 domain-containing protein [Actinomycetales bacterium]|nr:DUF2083 domain-containing protein [Actinomycetales bacterium]
MAKHFAGHRIRRLRSGVGASQVELARRLDLSTSYLNQLENDQRPLTVPVLMRLTAFFGVDATYFSDDADARLVADLEGALAGSGLGELPSTAPGGSVAELVARFPEVARHLVAVTRRLDEQAADIGRMSGARPEADRAQFVYERVRDFFYTRRNHVAELDAAAEDLASGSVGVGAAIEPWLVEMLDVRYGVRVVDGGPAERRRYDRATRTVHLPAGMDGGRRAFQLAAQIAFLEHGRLLDELVAEGAELDDSSRALARVGLAQYFAGATVLPYGRFLDAATRHRYDVDLLSEEFGVGFETVCHRLSTLQRPGRSGVPFLFVRTDRAGNISKRQSATAFHFSRGGGSCPLWVVHRAFETPHRIVRQVAEMPDGRRYLWIARTVTGRPHGFGRPVAEFAVGLGCAIEHADRMVYATGLDLADPGAATPIGAGCRVCDRPDCAQRAFPRSGAEPAVDEDVQSSAPYSTAPGVPSGP